jgi:hypothetical protein
MMKTILRQTPLALGITLALTTSSVLALDAQPIRNNGVEITPTLSADVSYNDNWKEANTGERSSYITTIAPSIKVEAKKGLNVYGLNLDASHQSVEDQSSADNTDYSLGANAHVEMSSRTRLDLNASYSNQEDIQDAQEDTEETNIGFTFGYGAEAAKLQLEFGVNQQDKEFSTDATTNKDFDATKYSAAAFYRVSGKTKVSAEYRQSDIDNKTGTLDGDQTVALVGAIWEATGKTSGSAKIGQVKRTFDAAGVADQDGTTWEVGVVWTPTPLSTVKVDLGNTYEMGSATERVIDTDKSKVAWNQQWSSKLSSDLSYSRMDEEYVGGANNGQDDQTDEIALKLTYSLARNADLVAGLTLKEKDSTAANSDYEQSVYNIGLKVGL